MKTAWVGSGLIGPGRAAASQGHRQILDHPPAGRGGWLLAGQGQRLLQIQTALGLLALKTPEQGPILERQGVVRIGPDHGGAGLDRWRQGRQAHGLQAVVW